jgi:hypothetical protein
MRLLQCSYLEYTKYEETTQRHIPEGSLLFKIHLFQMLNYHFSKWWTLSFWPEKSVSVNFISLQSQLERFSYISAQSICHIDSEEAENNILNIILKGMQSWKCQTRVEKNILLICYSLGLLQPANPEVQQASVYLSLLYTKILYIPQVTVKYL